jgi:protein TonB
MIPRADIAWSRQLAGVSAGAVALWMFAATVVLAAHAAAGWLILRDRPEPMADAAPPAAIMIDLAEMAMAPAAVEEQIAPDEVDSEAAEAVEAEPVEEVELAEAVEPEEVVEEVVETPPDEIEPVETAEAVDPEEVEQVEPIDPVEEMVAALDPVEVPLPIARPEPRREEPKPEPPRRKPQQVREKPKPAAPSTERRKARVEAPREAPRAAAPQNSSGASSSVSPARWQARLASHLERRKRYPSAARRQGQQGTAQVRFTIDGSGNVQSVSLVRSSGVALLDEEVVALVRRASPVPAPPPGVNRTIVVPIRFSVR